MNHDAFPLFGTAKSGPTAALALVTSFPSSRMFPVKYTEAPAGGETLLTVKVTGISFPVRTVNGRALEVAPPFACTVML